MPVRAVSASVVQCRGVAWRRTRAAPPLRHAFRRAGRGPAPTGRAVARPAGPPRAGASAATWSISRARRASTPVDRDRVQREQPDRRAAGAGHRLVGGDQRGLAGVHAGRRGGRRRARRVMRAGRRAAGCRRRAGRRPVAPSELASHRMRPGRPGGAQQRPALRAASAPAGGRGGARVGLGVQPGPARRAAPTGHRQPRAAGRGGQPGARPAPPWPAARAGTPRGVARRRPARPPTAASTPPECACPPAGNRESASSRARESASERVIRTGSSAAPWAARSRARLDHLAVDADVNVSGSTSMSRQRVVERHVGLAAPRTRRPPRPAARLTASRSASPSSSAAGDTK